MRKLVPLILTSIIWVTIGWFAKDLLTISPGLPLTPEQELVEKAQLLLQQRYFTSNHIAETKPITIALVDAAIDGMLKWGGDQFSDLYGPTATKRLFAGYEENIGITNLHFDVVDKQLVVTNVPPSGPAAKAGVQTGDILLGTNEAQFDEFVGGYEASLLMRGPAESIYELIVQRGQQIFTLPIQRQRWDYLQHRMIDNDIGYFTTEVFFNERTADAVKKILQEFLAEGVTGIIWDLRGSGGGATDPVKTIVSYFRTEGDLLFTAEFRDGTQQHFTVDSTGFLTKVPIVVLIDHGTFSASEIAAAAMAPRPQTKLIGETTSGKGTIQDTVMLDTSHSLHFTIAKWLTPSGQWVEKVGIKPSIKVVDNPSTPEDETLEIAIQYLRNR